jgi:hypothetical protein
MANLRQGKTGGSSMSNNHGSETQNHPLFYPVLEPFIPKWFSLPTGSNFTKTAGRHTAVSLKLCHEV